MKDKLKEIFTPYHPADIISIYALAALVFVLLTGGVR